MKSLELIKIVEYLNRYNVNISRVLKKSNDVYMKTKQYIEYTEERDFEGCVTLECSDCLLSFFCTTDLVCRCGVSRKDVSPYSTEIRRMLEKLCDLYVIVNGESK